MTTVASRELRNNTAGLLRRVEAGETIEIAVGGRAVATLRPLARRTTWMPKDELLGRLVSSQADPGLAVDLRELAPDTTDDVAL